jgi:hypothetical protein
MPGRRPPKGAFSINSKFILVDNTLNGSEEEPTHEKTVIGMNGT